MVAQKRLFALFLIGFCLLGSASLHAQEGVVLRLVVSDSNATDLGTRRLIEEYQRDYGVRVELVSNGNRLINPPTSVEAIASYLAAVQNMVELGDVVQVDSRWLRPEATQAGYFLDLAPIALQDAQLQSDDFLPVSWESVQWDGGIWALPLSYEMTGLVYQPAIFDATGIAYPDQAWTLDSLEAAARALHASPMLDENIPPILLADSEAFSALIGAALGENVADQTQIPHVPNYDLPALNAALEQIARLSAEGLLAIHNPLAPSPDSPIQIRNVFYAVFYNQYQIDPLPGNAVPITVSAFAVSRGTQHPEAAYHLARTLTRYPELAAAGTPVRQSILGIERDFSFYPPEREGEFAALRQALRPATEFYWLSYLQPLVEAPPESFPEALTSLQADLTATLSEVYDRRGELRVEVATPSPLPELPPGEVLLRFGVASNISPLSTGSLWQSLAAEFSDQDAQVEVALEIVMSPDFGEMAQVFDCFYLPSNDVPRADLSLLRSLDPLLQSDAAFVPEDFLDGVMQQVSRDNAIWGYPMMLIPDVMWYRLPAFEQAGLEVPDGNWSIEDFATGLQTFGQDEGVVFTNYEWGDGAILSLIAAYGGLPIDYRTAPPTINFTDPAVVDAIRQVLHIAKNGLMEYEGLLRGSSGSGTPELIFTTLNETNTRSGILVTMGGSGGRDYHFTIYPRGTTFTGAVYDLGVAYISASTSQPEGCYRLIAYLAAHPYLFPSMPVRHSLINSPEALASQEQEAVAFFQAYAELLAEPQTVIFPSARAVSGSAMAPVHQWLNRAFDRYVLEDADLETELIAAEGFAREYLSCIEGISEADRQEDYYGRIFDCTSIVDPTLYER